jgi:hypothetical protein
MAFVINSRVSQIIPLTLIIVLFSPFTYAKVIYVDGDAMGTNNGTSWINAYVFLKDALVDATNSEKPVEICIAQGVYKPDQSANQPPNDRRDATFQLINDVTLKGGYAGFGEQDPNERDIELHETILSGDLDGNDIQVEDPCDLLSEESRVENSYNVVTATCANRTAILDGFTIKSGNANGYDSNSCGGGLYISGSSFLDKADPIVVNCKIMYNSAINGGGMACVEYGSPTLTNCKFTGNAAQNDGGGLWNHTLYYTHSVRLYNCTFTSNYAGVNGGGVYDSGSTIIGCTFLENRSDSTGGGMRCKGNSTLVDCSFIGNQAQGRFNSGHGGGLYCGGTAGTLINCTFMGNRACGISGRRRGVGSRGGGMFIVGIPKLINCVFVGNSSGRGGGICYNSDSTDNILTNCTFSENLAEGDNIQEGLGGGIYIGKGEGKLNNCILWSNRDDSGTEQSAQISNMYGWMVFSARYCCIQDVNPSDNRAPSGKGNIDDDPLFVKNPHDGGDGWGDDPLTLNIDEGANDDYGYFHLQAESPCIDAGDNEADTGAHITASRLVGVDRAIHVRIFDDPETQDTGSGHPPIVDMGAYEFASPLIPSCILVDTNAIGTNNGTSWTDAMNSLHLAMRTAMASAGAVTEIWVAAGQYNPYESERDEYDSAFRLLNGLAVYGGFPSGGGIWEERDSNAWETTLGGRPHGTRHTVYIVTSIDCDHTAVLDGFTVTGNYNGAGMNIDNSDPTITNCIFADNIRGSGDNGLGIHNFNSNPTLTNCVFRSNTWGVAAYSEKSNPKYIGCNFEHNWYWAVRNKHSNPVFIDCIFSHNDSEGAMHNEYSNVVLSNCIFAQNSNQSGVDIYNLNSTVTLTTCTFAINSARSDGSAIYNDNSDATLTNCILWGCPFPQITGAITITYSNIEGGWPGEGNINIDPLFADPASGDYHLKSQVGRWDPKSEIWVMDDVTSFCIDAGHPNSDYSLEPLPNGDRINMGAYGGTSEASKSP